MTPAPYWSWKTASTRLNLVANAVHALGPRGGIRVRLRERPGVWALEVEDDGPGMAPEILAHLFEPLRTTRAGQGGVGLGLVSVRTLAEQDGGLVGVRSAPGAGTTVSVVYPAAPPAPSPSWPTAAR